MLGDALSRCPVDCLKSWVCSSLRIDWRPPAVFWRRGRCRWWLGPAGGQDWSAGDADFAVVPSLLSSLWGRVGPSDFGGAEAACYLTFQEISIALTAVVPLLTITMRR